MIETHVQKIAKMAGVQNAYQLQKLLVVSPSVAAKLWLDNFQLISKRSLDKLCRTLNASPAELITYSSKDVKQRQRNRQ